jgi:hypothetical protein
MMNPTRKITADSQLAKYRPEARAKLVAFLSGHRFAQVSSLGGGPAAEIFPW